MSLCELLLPSRLRDRLRHIIPLLCAGATACGGGATEPPPTLVGRFDQFWETFDQRYSYFSFKRINWDSLRSVYHPRAASAATQEELVGILREMVVPLRDVHVKFTTPTGSSIATYAPARMNWDRDLWLETIRSCPFRQARPNLGSCLMRGMAYIVVGNWTPSSFSVPDLDAVVDQFRDAPGMIIEVRPNGGGDDALALALAGRFANATTTIGYVRYRDGPRHDDLGPEIVRRVSPRGAFQFTRPVIVLSGRGVYSSSETFISAMREMPNVTVLGDTTGGGSGNPSEYPLGDGWRYSVPRWIEWTADRHIIEWNGIAPDVFVPWDNGSILAGRDPVLEMAFERLASSVNRTISGVMRQE